MRIALTIKYIYIYTWDYRIPTNQPVSWNDGGIFHLPRTVGGLFPTDDRVLPSGKLT